MASERAMTAGVFSAGANDSDKRAAASALCPACDGPVHSAALEKYGKYERLTCAACGLEFWEPREMPDARWYEHIYGGRDEELMPLEPGHKYFLEDAAAPRDGELLDVGCGTGNFLAAARKAGYRVTGLERGCCVHCADDQHGIAHGNDTNEARGNIEEFSRCDTDGAGAGGDRAAGKARDATTRDGDVRPNQVCGLLSFGRGGTSLCSNARLQGNVPVLPGTETPLRISEER